MMGTRGKQSAAELEVAGLSGQISVIRRPDPPLDLTPEEADIWAETVEALPADWFPRESWPLLKQWCRHSVTARRVSQMIDAESARETLNVADLKELLGMQAKETAALKALAASMRLSQQASYSARGAGGEKSRRTAMKRPWDK
jgi:prophage DNA circulation protein